jgi:signal transduction histidine kinase
LSGTATSIHRLVLIRVMGALVLGATFLIGGTWWLLLRQLDVIFEGNLEQVAVSVADQHGTAGSMVPLGATAPSPRSRDEYGQPEIVTVVWTREGQRVHSSSSGVDLPFRSRSGPSEVVAGGEKWHLYTIVLDHGIVQAAQREGERDTLARATASALMIPALLLLTLVGMLLTYALRRGLLPLSRAAGEVAARSVEALHPIPLASRPRELHLLIGAINDLMARLGAALALQRNFLADAAHELRTPITALRLQLQLLERASSEAQRDSAMDELRAGMARAQHSVEQLLLLSRLGPETPALQREPVDLTALAREAVGRFSARADELRIDIGAVVTAGPTIQGDPGQLAILLDNLVDNALRHTPAGGKVDVTALARDGQPCLGVADNGPGIPAAERERVFGRFYRSPGTLASSGSGLGLAIVRAVAQRHGATVSLDETPGGGLAVKVCFPSV